MSFVVDSSVTISWCMPDEQLPHLEALRSWALSEQLFVPAVWPLEMANVLGLARKTGRLTFDDFQIAFEIISQFEIQVAAAWATTDIEPAWAIMGRHGLSAYDASYLILALERNLPLATLDKKLAAAASSAGVPLIL